ncbi:carbohydrate esterase family 9 protein [Athelia psychrophila]|uniref:Carbohydrate esterase family 9 protein n=1 Tax=Athelia psychrophila TaxID=1759441 RepID=A0A166QWJ3_9AGAM|nr:carbohydrate esterase family 9 protein [Fibularhizoctonia sp. CBS 109695]
MTATSSPNGLLCFTNCLLARDDGSFHPADLWIDERTGLILDAQKTFFARGERPARTVDLGGNILSPGFMDIQINGAYGVDFSLHDGDDAAYVRGLAEVSRRIVETGVTALVPTIVTQEAALYPTLLRLLRPRSPGGAHILGWHAEGPFLQPSKRGAHDPALLTTAPAAMQSLERVYGAANLADQEDWLMQDRVDKVNGTGAVGVRIVTGAPELAGVGESVGELSGRGVVFSIGHSIAPTATAALACAAGARLITHLFNAMPQLHHRDPCIIGLLGASPCLASSFAASAPPVSSPAPISNPSPTSGANANPTLAAHWRGSEALEPTPAGTAPASPKGRGKVAVALVERPWYGLIVDGVHSHPNSVRLAYGAHPSGCILVTDAMSVLDPHLQDGVHPWRDGVNFVKVGEALYLEGTDTLAGSVVTMDKCVRNFARFTGCTLGEAIKCATFNPAKCLGIESRKGSLRAGADADLVVLDSAGTVLSTWVKGREVWTKA